MCTVRRNKKCFQKSTAPRRSHRSAAGMKKRCGTFSYSIGVYTQLSLTVNDTGNEYGH